MFIVLFALCRKVSLSKGELLYVLDNYGFINWGDVVNLPPYRVSKLTFRALALRLSLWQKANARNVRSETLYGGQFTLSTLLIKPNYLVLLLHWRSTTVSMETRPLNLFLSFLYTNRGYPGRLTLPSLGWDDRICSKFIAQELIFVRHFSG